MRRGLVAIEERSEESFVLGRDKTRVVEPEEREFGVFCFIFG